MSILGRIRDALIRRDSVPRVLTQGEAHPHQEWQGDLPLWGWDRAAIQTAAIAHDMGNFTQSERLYEAMTREGRIYSALTRRGEGVRVFPFEFDYRDETPDRIKREGATLLGMWPEEVLTEAERSEIVIRTLVFGFCVARVHRPLKNGQRVPKLEPWTHRTLTWTKLEVGWGWRGLDEAGDVVEIPRDGNDEWIVFSLGGKRPWLKGAIRPLARILYQILQTSDLWDTAQEKATIGLRMLTCPYEVREQAEVDRAWSVARKLRSGDTWLKPKNWDLELLESKHGDSGAGAFKERLTVLWATVAIIILYHNLTQETKGGSLAATKSAMDLPREAAVTDARILTIGYRQACRFWVEMNFAPVNYPELPRSLSYYAPIPEFETEEPADEKQEAETGQQNASALKSFIDAAKASGVEIKSIGIDWRETARRCNVALINTGDEEESEDTGKPPVVYVEAQPVDPTLPAKPAVAKMAAGRESESEGERLGGDSEPAKISWTA